MTYRVGGSWGITIVEVGSGEPDERGRRPDDRMVGVTMNDPVLASRIVELLNAAAVPRPQ